MYGTLWRDSTGNDPGAGLAGDRSFWLSGPALLVGGGEAAAGWLLFAVFERKHLRYTGRLWWPLNELLIVGGIVMVLGVVLMAQSGGIL